MDDDYGVDLNEIAEELGNPPIVETKNVPTEIEAGRVKMFIDPKGKEYLVPAGRAQRFIKSNGVDSSWIVK